jgi:hypothetical protein
MHSQKIRNLLFLSFRPAGALAKAGRDDIRGYLRKHQEWIREFLVVR